MAVTDNFNRADGGLGANWTTAGGFSALTIVSNTCKGSFGSQHNVSVYTGAGTAPADQYAQFKVTNPAGFIGPVLRHDGGTAFYTCYYNAGTATIYKWSGGSANQIGSGSTITPAVNDVVYLEAVGTALTMKVNGATVCTATDSSITAAGYVGIDLYDNVAAVDDFEGGAVAADVSVSLTGVAADPQIGTGTVTIAADVVVSLTGVAADPQIGTGTVTIGSVTVTPPVQELVPSRWFGLPEDEKVYLTGVAANPQVGNGSVYALQSARDIAERYPFPQRQVTPEPKRIPPLVVRAKPPPPPMIFVHPVGVSGSCRMGTGKVKLSYLIDEDEMLVLTAMMADL